MKLLKSFTLAAALTAGTTAAASPAEAPYSFRALNSTGLFGTYAEPRGAYLSVSCRDGQATRIDAFSVQDDFYRRVHEGDDKGTLFHEQTGETIYRFYRRGDGKWQQLVTSDDMRALMDSLANGTSDLKRDRLDDEASARAVARRVCPALTS